MKRVALTLPWVAMADAELPLTWAGAARSALGNSIWILPLVAIERLVDGYLGQAGILGVGWLVAIAVAVKLHVLQDIISSRERQRQLLTLALIICGVAILGAGLYRLGMQQAPSGPQEITKTVVVHDSPSAEEIAKAGGDALRTVTGERDALKEQNNLLRQKVPNPPPPPKPPRPKQTLTDLLTESDQLLTVVEKTLIPLQIEWRGSVGGKNPERICLDLDSQVLQNEMSSIIERLRAADTAILDVFKQNRIDQDELRPLVSYPDLRDMGPDESPLTSAAFRLSNYRAAVKGLGEHPTCEAVIKAELSRKYFEMTMGALNVFDTWLNQAQQRLNDYRDALRKELRNAP
jgi:hypothetical protein